jgi:hypothetical protein
MDPALGALLEHGLTPASLVGLFLVLYLRKDKELKLEREASDRELKLERDARIKDNRDLNDLALKLQGQVLTSVQTLKDVFDEIRRQYPRRGG